MESKKLEMQALFSELSEINQDVVILVTKGMKLSQDFSKNAVDTAKRLKEVALQTN